MSRMKGRDSLCFGLIDPHSRRTVLLLLVGGTILCTLWLSSSRAAALDYPLTRSSYAIGKQAYQAAFHYQSKGASQAASSNSASSAGEVQGGDDRYGLYDDTADEDWLAYADEEDPENWAFSNSKWDPLRLDSTPITEIEVRSCAVSPSLYDVCAPKTTKKEDATRGPWIRVDHDLNKRVGVYYLFVYVRRLVPNSRAPVITNVTLLTSLPEPDDLPGEGTWFAVSSSLRTGVWPSLGSMFLHYRLNEQADIRAARKANNGHAGDLEPITGIDVLYGGEAVQPLPGYQKISPPVTGGADDPKRTKPNGKGSRPGVSLAFRKVLPKSERKPALRFDSQGKYKILQVADLHFSVGPGDCRDVDPSLKSDCQQTGADKYSIEWLERALDTTKPDLVVLTGDQVNGQDTSWATQSVIMKWAPIIYSRKIPWTVIFGNHDREDDMSNEEQMVFYQRLPYFVGSAGPSDVEGTGNYMLSVTSHDSTNTTLLNLYFLDSHDQLKSINPFQKASYDYLKPSQINWFKSTSNKVKAIWRPYRPAQDFADPQASSYSDLADEAAEPQPPKLPFGADGTTDAAVKAEFGADEGVSAQANIAGIDLLGADDVRMVRRLKRQGGKLDAAEEAQKTEFDDMLSPQVISDGTQVRPDDPDSPTFEADQLDPFEAEAADLMFSEPTVLPAGPTSANPMKAKPNAMAFFHIPLPESYDAPIDTRKDGRSVFKVGDRQEGSGASKKNGQFFDLALLRQGELVKESSASSSGDGEMKDSFWDGEFDNPSTGRPEVKVVVNGHCHVSGDCRRVKGVWLCFGGGASYAGYGSASFERRMRVFEVSDFGETIETYALLDKSGEKDRTVLVGANAMEK